MEVHDAHQGQRVDRSPWLDGVLVLERIKLRRQEEASDLLVEVPNSFKIVIDPISISLEDIPTFLAQSMV